MSKSSEKDIEKGKFRINDNWLMAIGVVLGLIGGIAYWEIVGCPTGACPIYSTSITYILLGGALGGILFSFIADFRAWLYKRRESKK